MRLLGFLFVLLALPNALAAPTSPQAQAIAGLVQQAYNRCGQKVALSVPLSLAALDMLHQFPHAQALSRQKYRAWKSASIRATSHGNLNWLGTTLANRCGDWAGYTEIGLATDDTTVVIVSATPDAVDLSQSARWLAEFLTLTNRARFQGQKCGKTLMNSTGGLTWDPLLARAGALYLQDMVRLNFRGHISARDGSDPTLRAQRVGYRGGVGENLQYNAITPQEAIASLLSSPEHCLNLMDPDYTKFGAAVANGTGDTLFGTYWVQEFGTGR